ncbi:hypothetical protein B0H17DRAFT_1125544 [Mycena rosella]|uniref:Uncharacterized protein n=1 Tax=Mycena rosella TaxID=1033263 RepID=A0AAD7M9A5_MYCRO|nr:hypothetical protein B0H17DRAFT_1125544 [Mycena rosella]
MAAEHSFFLDPAQVSLFSAFVVLLRKLLHFNEKQEYYNHTSLVRSPNMCTPSSILRKFPTSPLQIHRLDSGDEKGHPRFKKFTGPKLRFTPSGFWCRTPPDPSPGLAWPLRVRKYAPTSPQTTVLPGTPMHNMPCGNLADGVPQIT